MKLLLVILAALACVGCSGEICRTTILDPHLLNPAAPSAPPGKKCEQVL